MLIIFFIVAIGLFVIGLGGLVGVLYLLQRVHAGPQVVLPMLAVSALVVVVVIALSWFNIKVDVLRVTLDISAPIVFGVGLVLGALLLRRA